MNFTEYILFRSVLIETYLSNMMESIVNNIKLLFCLVGIFLNTMSHLLLQLIKTSKTL
jgi:hypothetical protein